MVKIIVFLTLMFPVILFSQSVAINSDGSLPDNNAILDLKSNSKGMLMPRLTTGQRTGIVSAVPGLTVFDIETFSYWVYIGELNGGWAELLDTHDKHWDRTGTNVFNTNPGNVGIGTNNPTQKLAINATDPTIDFMNAGVSKGYLQASGNNMRLGTYANNTSGNLVFNTKAVDRMWIDENGKVGIGTSTPAGALTIDGSNPYLEMRTGGIYKGYLWASGNDMRLGTSAGNTTGDLALQTRLQTRMMIDENGKVAIGTTTPSTNGIFTINDTDPLVQFQNSGSSKGFIQVVDNDIKIGTNTSNNSGRFVVRTAGTDRFEVDGVGDVFVNNGDLYINESSPTVAFQKNNTILGLIGLTSGNDMILSRSLAGDGGKMIVRNGPSGVFLSEDGHANIGSGAKPVGYRLSVEGNAIAYDFTAADFIDWPDYVFADEYQLRPLAEVKKFIIENRHLPNIPAASEMEENGIQLGDMSKRLMEKVEELTLYVIQLNEQNISLQKQIDELKRNKE